MACARRRTLDVGQQPRWRSRGEVARTAAILRMFLIGHDPRDVAISAA